MWLLLPTKPCIKQLGNSIVHFLLLDWEGIPVSWCQLSHSLIPRFPHYARQEDLLERYKTNSLLHQCFYCWWTQSSSQAVQDLFNSQDEGGKEVGSKGREYTSGFSSWVIVVKMNKHALKFAPAWAPAMTFFISSSTDILALSTSYRMTTFPGPSAIYF